MEPLLEAPPVVAPAAPAATSPAILLVMTAVTGIVDAVSLLALGRVFTANMTGNIVLLGFALSGVTGLSISRSSVALAGFLIGAVAGGRMSLKPSSRHWVARAILVEGALLALSAVLAAVSAFHLYAVIAVAAIAMGLRNAVVRKLGVADLTTTVLTMTVTGLAADSRLAGGNNLRWLRRLTAIVAMLAGAAAGARMVAHSISFALAICSAIAIACAIAQMHFSSKRRLL